MKRGMKQWRDGKGIGCRTKRCVSILTWAMCHLGTMVHAHATRVKYLVWNAEENRRFEHQIALKIDIIHLFFRAIFCFYFYKIFPCGSGYLMPPIDQFLLRIVSDSSQYILHPQWSPWQADIFSSVSTESWKRWSWPRKRNDDIRHQNVRRKMLGGCYWLTNQSSERG